MVASKVVLTTSKTWLLEVPLSSEQKADDRSMLSCALKWRQGQLWVQAVQLSKQANIPALQNEQWLQDCLRHSPVNVVCLDPKLGVAGLKYWADACEQAGKPVFLRLRDRSRRSCQPRGVAWLGQRLDSVLAALLLMLLSPVLIGLLLVLRVGSTKPVFSSQWRVGARGRLFRLITFRECGERHKDLHCADPIQYWIFKLRLEGLPQLIGVAQGKLRLVGRQPWDLQEATQFCQAQPISETPGIVRIMVDNTV